MIDCTDGGAGLCGQILADLGADVWLVEPPGGVATRREGPFAGDVPGAERSLAFWSAHRGKRSLVLDLEAKNGREAFRERVARADVLVEDFPTGWLATRGLSRDVLAQDNPALIHASITPFGSDGPKAGWAATDLTVSAASNALELTGDADRPPLTCTVPQAFRNAAGDAAVGVMVALWERARSGRGQHVDVSAQTSMMMTTQSMVLAHGWGDTPLRRVGGGLRLGDFRLRFVYPCKDGYVNFTLLFGDAIGPATARFFQWMEEEGFDCEATSGEDWVAFGAKVFSGQTSPEQLEAITDQIEAFTRQRTKAELLQAAFDRRLLIVPLSDAADLAASKQLQARGFWTPLHHPELGRDVVYPGPFAKLSNRPIAYRRPPPGLGEAREEAWPTRPDAVPGGRDDAAPFEGLRVLDFSWAYAGPAVTRVLADFGATVVRVETATRVDALRTGSPFKDGIPGLERSANFSNINVGKLGLGLNLACREGVEIALRLVDWCDVLVENFSPRAMKAWGLDYETLHARKPDLIMLSSCLGGQTGPERMLAGYGTMGAALAGFGYLTGWPDRPPSAPFLAYTDYVSPRPATAALLAALEHRRRTGEGQFIDHSQAESSLHFLTPALLEQQVNGRVARRLGNALPHTAPSGVYPVAGEDRWLALAAPEPRHWQALAELAARGWQQDPRFATPAARLEHREALDEEIGAWTAPQEVHALEASLQRAGVPAHRVSTSRDCFEDPQLLHRSHFVSLEHAEVGPTPHETARIRLSRTPARLTRAGPTLGEHNHAVLSGLLGLSEDQIAELVVAGAIE